MGRTDSKAGTGRWSVAVMRGSSVSVGLEGRLVAEGGGALDGATYERGDGADDGPCSARPSAMEARARTWG